MKEHLKNYWLCYLLGFTLLFLMDYSRVSCCDETDQVCRKCQSYIDYYFGD